MLELDVGEVGRDLQHRFHVAEGGGKDDLVALLGQVADHTLGVGAFGHALDEGGLQGIAEVRLGGLAAQIVGERPAGVTHRADVDPGGLDRLGLGCLDGGRRRRRRRGLFLLAAANQGCTGQRGQRGHLDEGTFAQIGHGNL